MAAASVCVQGESQLPLPLQEVLQDQQVGLSQSFKSLPPLQCDLEHVRFRMRPLRVEYLFPAALWLSS